MNAEEVLDDAICLLEKRGWTQGAYENDQGQLCAIGAIRRAAGLNAGIVSHLYYPEVYGSALQAVAGVVRELHGGTIVRVNDAHDQTKEGVVMILEKARARAAELKI